MQTLDQKVEAIVEKINHNTDIGTIDQYAIQKLTEIVRLALKDQDRDTRHACAEAVNAVGIPSTIPGWGLALNGIKAYFYNAVMNCRGGIEKGD